LLLAPAVIDLVPGLVERWEEAGRWVLVATAFGSVSARVEKLAMGWAWRRGSNRW
jgi:hypothetical protein